MTGAEEAFDLVGRADADREVHTRDYKCQAAEQGGWEESRLVTLSPNRRE